jgi:hypothetical protein
MGSAEDRVGSPGSRHAWLRKEINGVDWLTATASTISVRRLRASLVMFGALAWSGFRRHATYRQATVAGAFTNVVFGFLR